MTRRIQMTRKAPWRADHPDAVIVARPSKWGNPYKVVRSGYAWDLWRWHTFIGQSTSKSGQIRAAVDRYREAIRSGTAEVTVDEIRAELAGRDLACWCPLSSPCHADTLLAIARGETP